MRAVFFVAMYLFREQSGQKAAMPGRGLNSGERMP